MHFVSLSSLLLQGEDIFAGAIREVKEETGVRMITPYILWLYYNYNFQVHPQQFSFFLAD